MIFVIHCSHCGAEGSFELQLSFEYENRICPTCHHIGEAKWEYFFCNLGCFFAWLKGNEVEEKGFPCQSCRATGFAFGFQQNGVCKVCGGTKRVKERVFLDHSNERVPCPWPKASSLKEPKAFFTDPKPSTMISDAKTDLEADWEKDVLERNLCCTTHCCTKHGCKYGLDDCPVMLGLCPTNHCEQCGLEEEGYYGEVLPDHGH